MKFAEFAQYKEWYENWLLVSGEFELSKERIRQRLLLLHGEVQQMHEKNANLEEEIARLKQENADYRAGRLLPAPFEAQIVSRLQLLRKEVADVETENKILRMQSSVQKLKENDDEKKHSFPPTFSSTFIPTLDPLLNIPRKMLITTIDMHTGGEPLRIIENGGPIFSSKLNLLQKRDCMINKFDHFRQFLMHEPRGHFDMYGALITECDSFGMENNADFAVLFMHNDGYSVMCGHGCIALGRYAVDFGLCKNLKINNSDGKKTVEVKFQVPCGIVSCTVQVNDSGRSVGEVSFLSPPAWAEFIKKTVHLEQFGKIEVDIGYGGTYYAVLPAARFNLNVRDSSIDELVHVASMVKSAVQKSSKIRLKHPENKELEYLYGVILTDGNNELPSCNVCVFADRQVDRCPTGSGVMARLAIDYAKKITKVGQVRQFIGKTGSVFHGCIKQVIEEYKGKECAVIVSVTGNANYCGRCVWYLEDGDNLGRGFLLK